MEKGPKAAQRHWFDRGEGEANATEVLVLAILTANSGASTSELSEWAAHLVNEKAAAVEQREQWRPSSDWPKLRGLSDAFRPVHRVVHHCSWPAEMLDRVGAAVQAWSGEGQFDGLGETQLRDYIKSPPPGMRRDRKTKGAERYKSWQIVQVAELIHLHGSQLCAAVADADAEALDLYVAWKAQGVSDAAELAKRLRGKSETEKIKELRFQIEMRTVGLGWTQFDTKWGYYSDGRQHKIEELKKMLLEDILPHEKAQRRLRKLPAAAAPPQLKVRGIKDLGTVDVGALEIEAKTNFNVSNLLVKAQAAQLRREAAGIADTAEMAQQGDAPSFDTRLVGKRLEVCWPYKKDGVTCKIWASGTVKRIADGLTDKRSKRAQKVLPAGAVLWAWEADPEYDEEAGEQWLVLHPDRWNKHTQYAWRYDPSELGIGRPAAARPARPPRAPRIDECVTEDEMYLSESDERPMECVSDSE